jgi:HlyD family secretion protein
MSNSGGVNKRTWIINAVLVLAILAVVALIALFLRPMEEPAALRTVIVEQGTATVTVTATGTVQAAQTVDLNFSTAGRVEGVNVSVGDLVEADKVLARIDDTVAQQQLAGARSTLAQALSGSQSARTSVSAAQQAVRQARQAAEQSNIALNQAVVQARSNLRSVQSTWSDACVNPDDPACPNPAIAAELRAAQNAVTSAQNAFDQSVALAVSNEITYSLQVNQAKARLDSTRNVQTSTCDASGASSTACASAQLSTLTAQQAYDTAINTQRSGLQADQQAIGRAQLALSDANVALQRAQTSAKRSSDDALRAARQALSTAEQAREQGRVQSAQAIATAEASLASAQAQVTRVDDSVGTAVDAAVESARAAVAVAEQTVRDARLRAPVAGTIGAVNIAVGEFTQPAGVAPAFTLVPEGDFEVVADFAETDAASVSVGAIAQVRVEALPGRSLRGTVTRIDPIAKTSANNLVTYAVRVSLDDPPADLRTGMTATVDVTAAEAVGVLVVPQGAISTIDGRETVEILQPDGTTIMRTITTGVQGDTVTEVMTGVSVGDELVIPDDADGVSFPQGGVPGR